MVSPSKALKSATAKTELHLAAHSTKFLLYRWYRWQFCVLVRLLTVIEALTDNSAFKAIIDSHHLIIHQVQIVGCLRVVRNLKLLLLKYFLVLLKSPLLSRTSCVYYRGLYEVRLRLIYYTAGAHYSHFIVV